MAPRKREERGLDWECDAGRRGTRMSVMGKRAHWLPANSKTAARFFPSERPPYASEAAISPGIYPPIPTTAVKWSAIFPCEFAYP
jgi:hypothetical protein